MPAPLIDITGLRYSKLFVKKRVEDYISPSGIRFSQWLCQCDCGNETIARKTHLTDGTKTSCGCEARRLTSERSMKDLTGQRFHMLVAKEITDPMKKEYCKLHNIPLFEIRYDENIEESINTILNEIYANTVPSSE